MATKEVLDKQIKKLKADNLALKKNNNFLLKQQKELKTYAEEAGSKCAKLEYELIKLRDKVKK